MRLRIVLPKVKPEVIAVPTRCVDADCGGRKFHLRQHVSKALRDTVYQEVQVSRYQCLRCKRTFRVYPAGTTKAQTSQRVKGLAVMLSLLGLSYGAVSLALEGLGVPLCKSRVYDTVQEVARRVPGLTRDQVFAGVKTPALAGDLTSVKCKGEWLPLGITVDPIRGLALSIDALEAEAIQALTAWIEPIAKSAEAQILVTDDADGFKTVADEVGLHHQVCKAHVSLPRCGRVPKAERDSSKSGKGLAWQKSKTCTRENSKSRQCSWSRPAASRALRRARELGISDTSIHQWRKELAQHGKEAFPGSGHQTPLEEENRRDPPRTRKSPAGARSSKKRCGHLFTGIQMTYQFIDQHTQEFPVVVMCRVLDVSESGFSAWRKRPTCQRTREDAHLTEEIRQEFQAHHGRYGSPRLHAEVHDQGRTISRKRVARLMREAGWCAKRTRRRVLTTRQDPTHPVAPNTLHRDFTAPEPHKKWVGDMTSIPTAHGWLYLAVILDRSSRIVVGWSMSGNCDEELVERALDMALARRRPEAGLLHHSDRGSHYPSRASRLILEQSGIVVRMSRTGNCWETAAMERFFGSLKEEGVGNTISASHEEARLALFVYLEVYSNRIRRHSTLGYVSPLVSEKRALQQAKQNV